MLPLLVWMAASVGVPSSAGSPSKSPSHCPPHPIHPVQPVLSSVLPSFVSVHRLPPPHFFFHLVHIIFWIEKLLSSSFPPRLAFPADSRRIQAGPSTPIIAASHVVASHTAPPIAAPPHCITNTYSTTSFKSTFLFIQPCCPERSCFPHHLTHSLPNLFSCSLDIAKLVCLRLSCSLSTYSTRVTHCRVQVLSTCTLDVPLRGLRQYRRLSHSIAA